jgi:hypothetical protein
MHVCQYSERKLKRTPVVLRDAPDQTGSLLVDFFMNSKK